MEQYPPYAEELETALLAVQRAVILTRKVLTLVNKGALSKADDSPVSIADFGAQALMVSAIRTAFPNDRIIGEENADALRSDETLGGKVWELVKETRLDEENFDNRLGRPSSKEEMLEFIDFGADGRGVGHIGRVWTMDPVDGTKPYLQGSQYCVVMALLVDGKEVLGVIACPKLDLESGKCSETDCAQDGPGWIVSAVRGHGAQVRQISSGELLPAQTVSRRTVKEDPSELIYVENMHNATPRFPERRLFVEPIGAKWPPVDLYSSSITYVALALGLADYQIRAPIPTAHASYVWDHAGGILIFEEVGGKVTDLRGNSIALGTESRQLSENYGNIAADASLHHRFVELVADVFKLHPEFSARLRE